MSEAVAVYKFCLLKDKAFMQGHGILWMGAQDRGWAYHQSQCPGSRPSGYSLLQAPDRGTASGTYSHSLKREERR